MNRMLMQIGRLLFMIMLAKQTTVNGDGDMIIYVQHGHGPMDPLDVSRSASIGDIVQAYASLKGDSSLERSDVFVNGQKKQRDALLADSGVGAESVVVLKREELDLIFERQERDSTDTLIVTDTKSIALRVNEDITKSLEHQFSVSPRAWTIGDGASHDASPFVPDYPALRVYGLQDVEIQLVFLSDAEALITTTKLEFIRATELLSTTEPEGVLQAQPHRDVGLFMTNISGDLYRWAARSPQGFGFKIKLRF